jgi:hypothetical protein
MTFRAEDQVSFQMTVKTDTTVNQQAGCPGNLHIFVSLLFPDPYALISGQFFMIKETRFL